jgi:cytochrome c
LIKQEHLKWFVARVLLIFFLILLLAVLGLAVTQTMTTSATKTDTPLAPEILAVIDGYGPQVRHGAEVYDLVCSNCHGNTGFGIAEGRAEFASEDQKCETCHRPNNAARKVDVKISERNSFNIGRPPALRGEAFLQKFAHAAGLHAYIRTAMPRYDPGVLRDQDYLDITAFLLALNNKLPQGTTLTDENISSF